VLPTFSHSLSGLKWDEMVSWNRASFCLWKRIVYQLEQLEAIAEQPKKLLKRQYSNVRDEGDKIVPFFLIPLTGLTDEVGIADDIVSKL
jgi:hypothetical protein